MEDLRSIPAPSDTTLPWMKMTPGVAGKAALSVGLMVVGIYYLVSGRESANMGRMITGAVFAIGSILLFAL